MDSSYLLQSPTGKQWETIGIKFHHGIVIPLFSIHSERSYGIGEFLDLTLMVDWCHSIGFSVIQLLPLNDTGLGSSPYSALSAFALNPIHLSLHALPFLHQYPELQEELKALPKFPTQLRVEYEHVRENKEHFLKHYFSRVGKELLESEAYQTYYESAAFWLEGYALFRTLKKRYHWTQWEIWPEESRNASAELKETLTHDEQIEFRNYCLLQFLCDQQLRTVKQYATEKGVFILGDIPILIDRDSADV